MISFAKPICGEARSHRNRAAQREGKVARRFAGWGLKWLLNHGDAAMLSGLWFAPSFQCAFSHVPASPGSPPFPLLTCWELVWYVAACQHLPSTSFSPGAHGCRASAAHTGLWGAAVTPTSSARCHTSPRCEGAVTHCDTPAVMFERARAQKQAHLISFLCEP